MISIYKVAKRINNDCICDGTNMFYTSGIDQDSTRIMDSGAGHRMSIRSSVFSGQSARQCSVQFHSRGTTLKASRQRIRVSEHVHSVVSKCVVVSAKLSKLSNNAQHRKSSNWQMPAQIRHAWVLRIYNVLPFRS